MAPIGSSNKHVQSLILWLSTLKFAVFFFVTCFLLYSYPGLLLALIVLQILEYSVHGKHREIGLFGHKNATHSLRGKGTLPLTLAGLLGITMGLVTFELFWAHVEFFDQSQVYRDVVPSSSPLALADASQIIFSTESKVDRSRGVGFRLGASETYCLAPIVETGAPTVGVKVNFFAVGMNCCPSPGTFLCDDAAKLGAYGGAVIGSGGLFLAHPQAHGYRKAKLKAESLFQIPENDDAIFLRWKKAPSEIRDGYQQLSVIFFGVSTLLFLLIAWLTRSKWILI